MDPTYAPCRPPPEFADVVVCQWDALMHGDHLMVPDACVEVMWLDGRGLVVCGPETTAWPVHHHEAVYASGVRLRPGIGSSVLRTPLSALTDARVGLDELLPSKRVERLASQIALCDPTSRSDLLLDFVSSRLADADQPNTRSSVATSLIEASSGIADLADALGTTTRTLHRRCLRDFGYAPSVLRTILRLQRALAWHKADPSLRLVGIAANAGYVDQAHLARDARVLAGLTPRQLIASESADWHGTGAVVSV